MGYAEDNIKRDTETLHYLIDITIRQVLDDFNIAQIDRMSRAKLVNAVVYDLDVLRGTYTAAHIRRLIEDELYNIGLAHGKRVRRQRGRLWHRI